MAKTSPDSGETHSRGWRLLAGLLVGGLVLFWIVRQVERPPAPAVPIAVPPPPPPPNDVAMRLTLLQGMMQVLEDSPVWDEGEPGDLQPLVDRLRKLQEKQRQKRRVKEQRRPQAPPRAAEAEWPRGPIEFVRFGPRSRLPVPGGSERDFHAISRHEGTTIEVRGRVGDRAATVRAISIQDGVDELKFERIEDVPAAYRQQVRGVFERATRGHVKP